MFGKIFDSVLDTVDEFVEDPLGKTVDMVTAPVRDSLEVIEGFTEGELRLAAAIRVGTDVAAEMAVSELIEMFTEED